ncbi:hypothetical protein R6Q59_027750 [Mikania micrantha]
MSVNMLTTVLAVTFVVTAVFLATELLCVIRRRRSSRLRTSQPPISGDNHYSEYSAKELLHIFCLKSQTRVEPTGAPTENPDGSSPEDTVIDVFKLLEANGPSRFLCTIKEDDGEYVESTSTHGGDTPGVTAETDRKVSLQAYLKAEAAEEKGMETVLPSPCDSPMFFTPVGSPARDGLSSELFGDDRK